MAEPPLNILIIYFAIQLFHILSGYIYVELALPYMYTFVIISGSKTINISTFQVITNPKFKGNIMRLSERMRDTLVHPIINAIYWFV